jgi:hypothetical protein
MKYLLALLFLASIVTAQEVQYYKYGQTGIELFYKDKDSMVVYHQYQAKMEIRSEVASIILNTYLRKRNLGGRKTVCTSQGEVTGFLTIVRKPKVVVLNFQYETIVWDSGIIEKAIIVKKKP